MKKERINPNTACIGDKISYNFHGIYSEGVVRKILDNSVIASLVLDAIYERTDAYNKIHHQIGIPEETVVNYKNYVILKDL